MRNRPRLNVSVQLCREKTFPCSYHLSSAGQLRVVYIHRLIASNFLYIIEARCEKCVSMVYRIYTLNGVSFAISADIREPSADPICRRRPYGNIPPNYCQFSGHYRASRRLKFAVRRFFSGGSPDNSAAKLHKLQKLRILCNRNDFMRWDASP
jgi:hypothetical protein